MLLCSFRRAFAGVAFIFFGAIVACSPRVAVGEVSGSVTFEGKAVAEGRVTFQSDAGVADEGLLNADGKFAVKKPLPVGAYKVYIIPLIVRQQADGKGPEVGVEKPAPDVPQKYRTIGATDLSANVIEGKNEFTFNMKR